MKRFWHFSRDDVKAAKKYGKEHPEMIEAEEEEFVECDGGMDTCWATLFFYSVKEMVDYRMSHYPGGIGGDVYIVADQRR